MKRVLVVEDDDAVRAVLSAILDDAGYSVETSATFVTAKKLLCSEAFDLLVADVLLPHLGSSGGSGIELADLARERGIRCILMTGRHEVADKITQLQVPYLLKPFRPAALLKTIDSVPR